MATIHRTTLTPSKLELFAAWLPRQGWYAGNAAPQLTKAGGFRLDDPDGEVGIEFVFVTDTSGGEPTVYQIPATYRGAPLPGADAALIGTTEHGVLGTRWVYDGTKDPVLMTQLAALLNGEAQAQAQSISDTPDPSIRIRRTPGVRAVAAPDASAAGPGADAGTAAGGPRGNIAIARVLTPDSLSAEEEHHENRSGSASAPWVTADGATARGRVASVVADPGAAEQAIPSPQRSR